MKVLVTGATGFTGSYVVPLLLERGIEVRCLVRSRSNRSFLASSEIEWVEGEVEDIESVKQALQQIDILINIVSIGSGLGPLIVRAAMDAKVKRAIFISTTSLFTQLNVVSKSLRIAAEEHIKSSGVPYSILRPTMIYGSSRDRNMCRLVRYIQRFPVIPILGSGEFLQQPVYVGDVARAIVECLLNEITINRTYNIAGAHPITYNQVIDTVAKLSRRKVLKIYLPATPAITLLSLLESRAIRLPIKSEQIARLNENKSFDYRSATEDFGYQPLSFQEGIYLELKEMGIVN